MTRLTVVADADQLCLSVETPAAGNILRVWHGDEAARILDHSIRDWRALGNFSARGRRVTRQVFLAATALALARDPARPGGRR